MWIDVGLSVNGIQQIMSKHSSAYGRIGRSISMREIWRDRNKCAKCARFNHGQVKTLGAVVDSTQRAKSGEG